MQELILFIGPPSEIEMDEDAVMNFLNENGEKIILGGTTVSIFERITGQRAVVDLSTAADGLPPYGSIAGITAAESALTLSRFNEVFMQDYSFKNAVSLLNKKIASTDRIKIYSGKAYNPVNGIDKKSVVSNFIKNIKQSGIVPEIVDY